MNWASDKTSKATSNPHNCSDHVDEDCVCTICRKTCHELVDNSNGSGQGEVTVWCKRCGKFERYYDDTGTIIESTF